MTNREIDESEHLHSFFINSEEFGKRKDYYVTTSKNEINVYNKKQMHKVTYKGLEIRGAMSIHQ